MRTSCCLTTSGSLLVEVTHVPVLWRHGHCSKVMVVTNGLEIAADQEQIYFVLLFGF